MCDPVTIAVAGAAVAGSVMQANDAASNQAGAINAKNTGTANLIAKENGLSQQGTGLFNNVLQPYQNGGQAPALAGAQTDNTDVLNNNAPTAAMLGGGSVTANAPKVVQDSANSTIANRIASIGTKNTAMGNLTGYDTNNQNNSRSLKGAADQIGTLGNFATEDANTGTALTNQAVTNSQKPPGVLGDVLSGVGGIGLQQAGRNGALDGVTNGVNGAFSNLFSKSPAVASTPLNFFG